VTSIGSAEEHALRPHGRGELPLGRRRGRRRADRGRRGDHAGGRAGRSQRRRGQRAGLPPCDPLGGPPGSGAHVLLAASHPAGHPAVQLDDGPRDRGPGLPAAVGGQGGSDPACCDAGPHRRPASPGPARPAASGVARLARLAQVAAVAVAMAVGPVPASPPPMIVLWPWRTGCRVHAVRALSPVSLSRSYGPERPGRNPTGLMFRTQVSVTGSHGVRGPPPAIDGAGGHNPQIARPAQVPGGPRRHARHDSTGGPAPPTTTMWHCRGQAGCCRIAACRGAGCVRV
jgi:hypothetical protein